MEAWTHRGTDRPEVRRHLGRRHRAHQERRPALPRGAEGGARRRGGGLRDVRRDQPPAQARRADHRPADEREQDVVVATGEQVSIGLRRDGDPGAGGQGDELPRPPGAASSPTAPSPRRASRASTRSRSSRRCKKGTIAVVAGFQGVDEEGNVTTLGRGGSDTTAVAIAAALKADALRDLHRRRRRLHHRPERVPGGEEARPITYEEMLELASLGAKVLQIRSVEFAMKYKVPALGEVVVHRRSGHAGVRGGRVDGRRGRQRNRLRQERGEDRHARRARQARASRRRSSARSTSRHIVVDLIVQTAPQDGQDRPDLHRGQGGPRQGARRGERQVAQTLRPRGVETDDQIAKVSIVGVGMRNHSGVAAKMFQVLSARRASTSRSSPPRRSRSRCLIAREVHRARGARAAHRVRAGPAGRAGAAVTHGRTAALAVALLGALAAGSWAQPRWPEATPALDCPAEKVTWVGEGAGGAARCGPGAVPPASVRAALGLRLSLNQVAEAVPGAAPGCGTGGGARAGAGATLPQLERGRRGPRGGSGPAPTAAAGH